jgi:CDP-diacylglycerol--serine O-phosphatidyltransferase
MNKIKYIIPSLFTSLSLLSALIAIYYISVDEFVLAPWLIIFSMICDFLDGTFARKLNAASSFGAQYDTLSDFVAFGIAPAFLAYRITLHTLSSWGMIVAVLYVFSGCYRLVRFTLRNKHNPNEKKSFIGLPIPMAAGFISASVIFSQQHFDISPNRYLFLSFMFILSLLMVSRIEYLTIDKSGKYGQASKVILIIASLSIIFSFSYSYVAILFWISVYILFCLIRQIIIQLKIIKG